jgi:hypothetical protein
MLVTSFDVNVEVLNVSSKMMIIMMVIIIIITWMISSLTVHAGFLMKPEGSAVYMLPKIAIMK